MILRLRSAVLPLSLLSALAVPSAAQQQMPRTFQEVNNFRAGPTPFDPLMEFWYELDRLSPEVSIRPLTRTLLDRELTLVTIASEPILTPEDALRSGKTIVLIANSPHGNEPAGKEAAQLIARDLITGELRPLLNDLILLVIPLLNPDGGEVPTRVNTEGFDLNRDYLKLESTEIHSVVTQVLTQWTPDIYIDTHHGGSAPYTLTWQATLNPAADAEMRAYPYQVIIPAIRAALRAEDYDGFDYSGTTTVDGVPGWGSTSIEPRKHHVYTGMTNTIGLLFETPSSSHRLRSNGTVLEAIPQPERYFHQVRGQYLGQRAVLQVAAQRRAEIRQLTTGSRLRAIRNGMTYDEADQVVLEYRLTSRGREQVWVSQGQGNYAPETREVFLRYEATRTTPRPLGYVLPPSMGKVVPLLLDHGIVVHRFTQADSLELETYRATEIRDIGYFQGHYLRKTTATKATERMLVPVGSYYISTAQSMGNLIAYLMEPETDDNLITWGWADHLLQVTGTPDAPGDDQAGAAGSDAGSEQQQQAPRVPMMRVVRQQPMSLMQVVPFNDFNRTRYYQVP